LYTESDHCKKCGRIFTSRYAYYDGCLERDIEWDSKYSPFCSAKCEREWNTGNGYYRNREFMNEIWNGKGESYIPGKGYLILQGNNGFKYQRQENGNWCKVA
jgi:hypothetical protein